MSRSGEDSCGHLRVTLIPVHPNFVVRGSARVVEAWSTARLPFEPKGWLRDFRSELQVALRSLDRRSDLGALHADYASADTSSCDVENVTLFNVGSGFAGLGTKAIVVERAFDPPPPSPVVLDGDSAHYWRYEVRESVDSERWSSGRRVASWSDVEVPAILSASNVWWSMRQAPAGEVFERSLTGPVGITVRIGSPSMTRSLLSMMKATVDGVIAAFHSHTGGVGEEAVRRLAASLGQPVDIVFAKLADDALSALGARRLLWSFGNGVQWNPADDRLVVIKLEEVRSDVLTIRGEICECSPAHE